MREMAHGPFYRCKLHLVALKYFPSQDFFSICQFYVFTNKNHVEFGGEFFWLSSNQEPKAITIFV